MGGADGRHVAQPGATGNRHGLVAGATGTGKTVTLQILAEGWSRLGVPVFTADVKGDLSGLAAAAAAHPKIDERIARIGIPDYTASASPVALWDLFGVQGMPVRLTISEMGPLLLARLLGLNETQTGVLYATFRAADDDGLLLLDLKDLRAMLVWMGENAKALSLEYGNISAASIGAIQRRLLRLEEQGAAMIFGEPALDIRDLMTCDAAGRGVINILDATALLNRAPDLYACFLLWLLSELFEELPEQGDAEKPRFVMFFDEAHLVFDQAPPALLQRIEQVVRLIRSKGVGVYFVTQSPADVPDDVLGQLGLKIQHALRAFTPRDRKAVKVVAESFRPNPNVDAAALVTELGTGEALVSVLAPDGRPTPVEQVLICPPRSRIGPLDDGERAALVAAHSLRQKYARSVDRQSAYEELARHAGARAAAAEAQKLPGRGPAGRRSSTRQSAGEAMLKSTVRAIGSSLGRQIVRGLLGSLFGGRRR
ncbi:MAG: helicase HerA-like domain-containing protein [Gammaproteobacteria bacterium]